MTEVEPTALLVSEKCPFYSYSDFCNCHGEVEFVWVEFKYEALLEMTSEKRDKAQP